jgi:protocatechuate 3,4-dioxygenase beta subunit
VQDNYTVRTSRREFLIASAAGAIAASPAAAAARQRGLEQFLQPAPPCTDDLTPAAGDGGAFRPGAPDRRAIAPDAPGAPLVVTGYVVGLKCGRIAGARLHFWQPDARGAVDRAGFRLRGQQRTDAEGRYRLETIVPGPPPGRAPFIGVRVEPPKGAAFSTRLFLPDDPSNARDPEFTPRLALKRGPAGAFTFDFLLDL